MGLELVAGSGRTGESLNGLVSLYKMTEMCVNLEWVAGFRRTGEGLDGLLGVLINY